METVENTDNTNLSTSGDHAPCRPEVGMEFDSMDHAWEFWMQYGKKMGFGVRKHILRKSKVDHIEIKRIFCCSREGKRGKDKRESEDVQHRWDTRVGCEAKLDVRLVRESNKCTVHQFIEEHNHDLEPEETRHLLRCNREVTEVQGRMIEMAHDAGLRPKDTHELMVIEAGGRTCVGYTIEDQKSYLRDRRQRCMQYGEAGAILTYFKNQKMRNSSFFSDMQLDTEDHITNMFWADAEMVVDYQVFGDVVTFDTTYGTNKGLRPFGVFTGFNHHKQMVTFGAALLYDETAESFEWLFETFLKAHGGKAPLTIFTDQDAAMAKALQLVMPGTWHGLCTWHILQNATKNLGGGSQVFSEFRKCMFDYTNEDDFEAAWATMAETFARSKGKLWLDGIYCLKGKWAACYMKSTFTLGIRSTQLSESLNSDLKTHLKCDLNARDFFHHFHRVLEKKRYKELEAEFASRQKTPNLIMADCPLMIQAAEVYTPTIFRYFQHELLQISAYRIKQKIENQVLHEYILAPHKNLNVEYKVLFDHNNNNVECMCRLFETTGLLCCHALKVFSIHDMVEIPQKYILTRWTKFARNILPIRTKHTEENEDLHTWSGRMASQYMRNCLRLGTSSSGRRKLEENLMVVTDLADNFAKVDIVDGSDIHPPKEIVEGRVKGVKNRGGRKTTKRPKSCLEKRKAKKIGPSTQQSVVTTQDTNWSDFSTLIGRSNYLDDPYPTEWSYTQLLTSQHIFGPSSSQAPNSSH